MAAFFLFPVSFFVLVPRKRKKFADLNGLHVQWDELVGACNPPCLPFNGVMGIQEAHIGNT